MGGREGTERGVECQGSEAPLGLHAPVRPDPTESLTSEFGGFT